MYTKQFIEDHLASQCHGLYMVYAKRPGIYQVSLPIFYEDGDAVEIFVEEIDGGNVRISDYGMSLMRLSYDYDIDSPNKESILSQIIAENRLREKDGIIYTDVPPDEIYPGILQLASGISKIGSMKYFKKEVIQSLFYESVETFIVEKLANLKPEKHFRPIKGREELEVDFLIKTPVRPLFIYPVKSSDKAKNVIINCLSFQKEKIPFTSVIILENMDVLTKKDQALLTNIADKQYASFEAFSTSIESYVERESMLAS